MSKKDVYAILTNLNIAHQGQEIRQELSRANRLHEREIQAAERQAEYARRMAKEDAERQRLYAIELDDMLPIEAQFRGAIFPDDEEEVTLWDDRLAPFFVDMLSKSPTGDGKYFKWEYEEAQDGEEYGAVQLTQKDAWLVAKGRDPQRVKKQRQKAQEKYERETKETAEWRKREKDKEDLETAASRRNLVILLAIVIALVVLVVVVFG